MKSYFKVLIIGLGLLSSAAYAQSYSSPPTRHKPVMTVENPPSQSLVNEREQGEEEITPNNFAITLYKPTYVLPFYYTVSPYNSIYSGNTPYHEAMKHPEFKYQLSFKVPAWKNIFNFPTTLYVGYTQMSYWQLYAHHAFFRETDYEPEFFLATNTNWRVGPWWHLDFINLGAVHQSNGYGNNLERSWNRIYLDVIASTDNWMISVKPWYVFKDSTYNNYNPNMADFLGYGRLLVAYKLDKNVLSLSIHNFLIGQAKHLTGEVTWSFPLTKFIKGYVQVFSGYGQSLIEYNHHTNSAGIGVALNDWV